MNFWELFQGPNAGYVLELYERYRQNPQSVDEAARQFFEHWTPPEIGIGSGNGTAPAAPIVTGPPLEKIVAATNYASAIREYGHLMADLDPLGSTPPGDPSVLPENYGLSDDDLRRLPATVVGGPIEQSSATALEAIRALRQIYMSTVGYDYDHIRYPEERAWLREAAESGRFRPPADPIDPIALLDRLTQVEAFEQFLHRIFPGKHRFSIEGVDTMVPIMDDIIVGAAGEGIYYSLLGMAHRGRLNGLAHILMKPYVPILAEFKDPVAGRKFRDDLGWTGDVKYHAGPRRAHLDGAAVDLNVTIAPNPSHLEAVNPVVEGMARA